MSHPTDFFRAPTESEWLGRIAADDPEADVDRLVRFTSPEGWSVRAFYRQGEVEMGASPAVRPAGRPWEIRVAGPAGHVPGAEPDTIRVFAVGPERPVGPLLDSLGSEPVRLVPTDVSSARDAVERADPRVLSIEFDAAVRSRDEAGGWLDAAAAVRFAADGTAAAIHGPATAVACVLRSLDRWFDAGRVSGVGPGRVADRLLVRMPAFDAFFVTVAGLRAAREAVDRLAEAWGVEAGSRIPLHAVAGPFPPASGDDGLVRAAIALAACACGGGDGIELVPPAADTGRTVTRYTNLHRLLMHEGRLHEADDPAGGAWYLEELTRTIGETAWAALRTVREREHAGTADIAAVVRAIAGGSSDA